MLSAKKNRALSFVLTGVLIVSGAACGSSGENADTPPGLVVVNASRTGTVKRVLVSEDTEVAENAVLIEIAVPTNNTNPPTNSNRPPVDNQMQNQGRAIADAEQQLQSAAVELQRIEPLVASDSAPQAQLDAARAVYQQAQERRDELRRSAQNPQINPVLPQSSINSEQNAPENIIAVRAPVAGNVRVLSTRIGQPVRAGEPIATISTAR